VARKGTGHGEEEWGERSNRGYIYPRKFVLPDYRPEGTGTTGEVDSRRQPTRGNELPVVDRYYRSETGTTGHPLVLTVVPAQQKIRESW
jgi:hypothetical protein